QGDAAQIQGADEGLQVSGMGFRRIGEARGPVRQAETEMIGRYATVSFGKDPDQAPPIIRPSGGAVHEEKGFSAPSRAASRARTFVHIMHAARRQIQVPA